jgi:hypothetical protein
LSPFFVPEGVKNIFFIVRKLPAKNFFGRSGQNFFRTLKEFDAQRILRSKNFTLKEFDAQRIWLLPSDGGKAFGKRIWGGPPFGSKV